MNSNNERVQVRSRNLAGKAESRRPNLLELSFDYISRNLNLVKLERISAPNSRVHLGGFMSAAIRYDD